MRSRVRWTAGICLAFLLLATGGLGYLGAFASVEVTEERVGPFSFAYVEHVGDYDETGRLTAQVAEALERAGLPGCKPLAVYFDDPATVEVADLKSEVGCAIDAQVGVALQRSGSSLALRRIVARRSMVARFPWRSPLSFLVGFYKVGSALERYRAEHDYAQAPVLVLLEGDVLTYAMPTITPRTAR